MEDQYETHSESEDESISTESVEGKRKRTIPPSKKTSPAKKKRAYEFQEEDAEIIENAIIRFGLNYKSIHEKFYKEKTSLNKLKEFISSDSMIDVKESAKAGFLFFFIFSLIIQNMRELNKQERMHI